MADKSVPSDKGPVEGRPIPSETRPVTRNVDRDLHRPGPSWEMDNVPTEDPTDAEPENVDEDPKIVKALRTQVKAQTTKLMNKIAKAIASKAKRSEVKSLRSQLVERVAECSTFNERLARAEARAGMPRGDYPQWISEVEDAAYSCYLSIDGYLTSGAGSSRASSVISSASSKDSRRSKANSQASNASRLQAVRQERQLTEFQLQQMERDAAEEAAEERRLRDFELERQELLKKRKHRELRSLLEKQRAEEQILESVESTPVTSVPVPPPTQNVPSTGLAQMANHTVVSFTQQAPTQQPPTLFSSPGMPSLPSTSTSFQIAPPVPTANEAWIYAPDAPSIGSSSGRNGKQAYKAKIKTFTGDAKEWPMFISSFRSLVHNVVDTDDQRLAILRELLAPKVRKGIAGALNNPALYRKALERLHRKYGHPYMVTRACLQAVLEFPRVKENSFQQLEDFADELHSTVETLISCQYDDELRSSALLGQLVAKLPSALRDSWGEDVEKIQPRKPTLVDLDIWLEKKVDSKKYGDPSLVLEADTQKEHGTKPKRAAFKPSRRDSTPKAFNVLATSQEAGPSCSYCKKSNHDIANCRFFAAVNVGERALRVKDLGLCLRCLGQSHLAKDCASTMTCGESGCKAKHHTLLHNAPRLFAKGNKGTEAKVQAKAYDDSPPAVNKIGNSPRDPKHRKKVLTLVVPVQLRANGRVVNTFAYLDGGSEQTIIREDIARQLLLDGPLEEMEITTVKGRHPPSLARTVNFQIASMDGANVFEAENAMTMDDIEAARRIRNTPYLRRDWPHLRDIPLSDAEPGEITVLIGDDVPEAIDIDDIRKPPQGVRGPRAVLTPFGWCVRGPVHQSNPGGTNSRQVMKVSLTDLDESVKAFWTTESLGVQPPTRQLLSEDESKALKTLEDTVRLVDDRYEAGLLWSSPTVSLPDNRNTALRRFFALERKLKLHPELATSYSKTMEGYLSDGHARKVQPTELGIPSPRTWYLPHHAVTNPNKPGKVRVVFDAAAETDGVSLNHVLLAGPDLLNNLLGVLLRFREYSVAVSADIKSMFHQVRVISRDRPALRFFWRPPGSSIPPQTYEMTVQIFGAKSSPTVCNYVLRKTAQDQANTYPDIPPRVERNFYVDDYLDSVPSEQEAVRVCRQLKEVLVRGGFPLTKWKSSSRTVLASLPAEDRVDPQMNLDLDHLPVERTLGVWWDAETDEFAFRVKQKPVRPTKRELLRIIASVFDPIGFLIPVTLTAKALLQELWRLEIQWDDEIPDSIAQRWNTWLSDLQKLEAVAITRCLQPFVEPSSIQLHVFADASELAFGAVAYLRVSDRTGIVVNFITAKSRVAPLRQLTIPRLELQGALLAARIAHTITVELRLKIDQTILWTDSSTVLKWIRSKTYRFKTFVANRIAEIGDLTETSQWKHVPGKLNPADDCSRGLDAASMILPNRWFNGPAFLKQPSSQWPAELVEDKDDEAELETLPPLVASVTLPEEKPLDPLLNTSNLHRMKRTLAWILRFIKNTRPSKFPAQRGQLTVPEIRNALLEFIKIEQERCFPSEFAALRANRPLPRTSKLLKLTPFLDEKGLLRVGGRILHADIPSDAKHPILLSPDSPLTTLIIRNTHERLSHGSTERTLAELRLQYWITSGRSSVNRVVNDCFACKRYRAKPNFPLMAALPQHRLEAFSPPFSNVGVDYFGPFMVVIHRRIHKRYVCLFTCLVTRAVHLEVAHTLDTDSFLMAFRRFVGRRGTPSHVYSDNGTNLSAGEREIRQCLKTWNENRINDELAQRDVTWHFSPPASPHFGGVWESLVRSAKVALRHTLRNQSVTDEVLVTVMVEVEALLNGRPLTHISINPEDPEPLTPNHFLLGRANPNLPMDVVTERDLNARKRWRTAQAITEKFWARWLREYVPSVIERRKWLRPTRSLRPDDVVLLIEENTPRGLWPLARIIDVYPGPDGVVRTVLIKTKNGEYVRPAAKLCLLELAEPKV